MTRAPGAADTDDILVSCLMVTWGVPRRLPHLRRSVAAYGAQTHRNRELVVISKSPGAEDRAATAAFFSSLGRSDIRFVAVTDDLSLGAQRNLSREVARGSVFCQWDDDDLSHPERLEQQLAALTASGAEAVGLQEVMQYFPATRTLYCTNWRATENKCHPATIMCRRSAPIRYPETGPTAARGEDSAVVTQLQQRGAIHYLAGAPHLFVYVSHGANTWTDDFHRRLSTELAQSQALLRRREAALRAGLRPFDFDGGTVTVEGSNGTAFTLERPPAAPQARSS